MSYLVPGINIEDLSADSAAATVLLDWFKVRGTDLPSTFVHKDLRGAFFGTANNAIKKESTDRPRILFRQKESLHVR
jgi:hypothetical protein